MGNTSRLLVRVQHAILSAAERPHDIMEILEKICIMRLSRLAKALKVTAIEDTVALVADNMGGAKWASAQMSWYPGHPNPDFSPPPPPLPPPPARQCSISTHPKRNIKLSFATRRGY